MDEMTIRRALLERRAELAGELERLTEPPAEGQNLSFGKRVGDGTAEAVERIATTATARTIDGAIRDVDRAIEKLEEGTYGACDRCGDPIAPERLQARPASALCHACASTPG